MKASDLNEVSEEWSPENENNQDENTSQRSSEPLAFMKAVQGTIISELQVEVDHLMHPGEVFVIGKADSVAQKAENNLVFPERVILTETMFSDHNPDLYSSAFGCNINADAQYLNEKLRFQFSFKISDGNIAGAHRRKVRSVSEWLVPRLLQNFANLRKLIHDLFSRLPNWPTFKNKWLDVFNQFLKTHSERKRDNLEKRLALPGVSRIKGTRNERIRWMCSFARNIYYTWSSKTGTAPVMGVELEDIVLVPLKDDGVMGPKFLIVVHHESKSVVLVLRGTRSMEDILIDQCSML